MQRTPRAHNWRLAIALGALLGAVILGVGGRLAMRGISLMEARPLQLSLGGTMRVILAGGIVGTLAACLRACIATFLPVRVSPRTRTALYVVLVGALAVVGLTPLTVHRLALFLPVVGVFVLAVELCWRRWARPIGAATTPPS